MKRAMHFQRPIIGLILTLASCQPAVAGPLYVGVGSAVNVVRLSPRGEIADKIVIYHMRAVGQKPARFVPAITILRVEGKNAGTVHLRDGVKNCGTWRVDRPYARVRLTNVANPATVLQFGQMSESEVTAERRVVIGNRLSRENQWLRLHPNISARDAMKLLAGQNMFACH